ncbi:hypothetical protein ZIOFF_039281 [Zingiber officinale]|uniref:Uncharacterized protein n=1 Tax=Zingiber officinale TaxID=94328 RepID=A0A8J5G6N0_ZINOF|nr:hypothetical protein ZIOFF_039281 [Zingiber officinale]
MHTFIAEEIADGAVIKSEIVIVSRSATIAECWEIPVASHEKNRRLLPTTFGNLATAWGDRNDIDVLVGVASAEEAGMLRRWAKDVRMGQLMAKVICGGICGDGGTCVLLDQTFWSLCILQISSSLTWSSSTHPFGTFTLFTAGLFDTASALYLFLVQEILEIVGAETPLVGLHAIEKCLVESSSISGLDKSAVLDHITQVIELDLTWQSALFRYVALAILPTILGRDQSCIRHMMKNRIIKLENWGKLTFLGTKHPKAVTRASGNNIHITGIRIVCAQATLVATIQATSLCWWLFYEITVLIQALDEVAAEGARRCGPTRAWFHLEGKMNKRDKSVAAKVENTHDKL